jgi:predicted ATPase/DNA-binding SARP family transcriptional activator
MNLALRLLGTPLVRVDGVEIAQTHWQRADAKRLFFVLALKHDHQYNREQLCQLLLPTLDKETGRTKLNNTLYSLRKALGNAGARVASYRDVIELKWDDKIDWDVENFERRLDAAACSNDIDEKTEEIEQAILLYQGELLQGFPDEPWFMQDRALLKVRHCWALDELVKCYLAHGRIHDAIRNQHARIRVEPLHQVAHAKLLTLLLDADCVDEAIAHYKQCRDLIAGEFGQAPCAEIQAIYTQIKEREAQTSPYSGAALSGIKLDASLEAEQIVQITDAQNRSCKDNLASALTCRVSADFVGRNHDILALLGLLREPRSASRIITVTGFGGVGKTALVRAVTSLWEQSTGERASFLDVGENSDPRWLADILKQRLMLSTTLLETTPSLAIDGSAEKAAGLLVLDSFEHFAHCAGILSTLAERCANLQIVVTSRIALNLSHETMYALAPLDVETHAVELFVLHASTHSAAREFNEREMEDIAQICALLDGLPLAIKLAATRMKLFGTTQLLARLKSDLRLLRASPQRAHTNMGSAQSLWDLLGWTYRLLEWDAKELLAGLAAFQGGFTLKIIEDTFAHKEWRIFDLLDNLISLNLVVPMQTMQQLEVAGDRRFMLMEKVRQFIAEVANEVDPERSARIDHANYFLQRIRDFDPHELDTSAEEPLAFFNTEAQNIITAIELQFTREPKTVAPLACLCLHTLQLAGYTQRARAWVHRLNADYAMHLGEIDRERVIAFERHASSTV